mmetsp:Transcript_29108/g.53082  ORF Transcript_29108/g.53082 Transcript_29108/m.53082 type:complete len:106 (-) Transcript_29108:35-352(-)
MRTIPATKKMMATGMKNKPNESSSFSVKAWADSGVAAMESPYRAAEGAATSAPRKAPRDAGAATKQQALNAATASAARMTAGSAERAIVLCLNKFYRRTTSSALS